MKQLCLSALCLTLVAGSATAAGPSVVKNVVVYSVEGRYGGWPANHGIWQWNNEIVVGFSAAYFKWLGPDRHPYDRERSEEPYMARSVDGGEHWTIESVKALVPPKGMYAETDAGSTSRKLIEPMDFTNPGFCMTVRMMDAQKGTSWFFYSYDRGRTWKGPFDFPMLGQKAIMARTDYIVNGKRDMTIFLTAAKAAGAEGRVLAARTKDGGVNWSFQSWVSPDPGPGFTIMPSSVRLSAKELVTSVRHRPAAKQDPTWIDIYASKDDGATWSHLSKTGEDTGGKNGNPPSLVKLKDGRLAMTYGTRSAPYEIRARLSSDGGKTWSEPLTLRSGAASWDVGYTRSVQRPDGKIVTAYYWSAEAQKERTIEATIWDPGAR